MRPHSDLRPTQAEFARELGLDDAVLASDLYIASGGLITLGRAALDVAARTAMPIDVSSTSFADYVAAKAPDFAVGASANDLWVAAVLSHLGVFTRQTGLMALSSIAGEVAGDVDLRDPEGTLMRLRLDGILIPVGAEGPPNALHVPTLLAAKLRRDLSVDTDEDSLVGALVDALVDHLESSHQVDPPVLAETLSLTRRAGLWSQLSRIGESVGLPMFLLAPRQTCSAFGCLPAAALNAAPELSFLSELTDDVLDRSANGLTPAEVRGFVVEETRAGRLRQYFPDAPPGDADGISTDSKKGRGTVSTVRQMMAMAQSGDHLGAATLGRARAGEAKAARARSVIGLFTAIAHFHAAQFQRALSLLHDI